MNESIAHRFLVATCLCTVLAGCGEPPESEAAPPSELVIEPAVRDFGPVRVGETSELQARFEVANVGEGKTGAMRVNLRVGDFSVVSNRCRNRSLEPGEECSVEVEYAPTFEGEQTRTLTVSASNGGSASAEVRGVGAGPGALVASPLSVDMGTVAIGGESEVAEVTIRNDGNVETGNLGADLGDSRDFEIAYDECSTLAPRETCVVGVQFLPRSLGRRSATLMVSGDADDGVAEATLYGDAVQGVDLSIDEDFHDFGFVRVNDTARAVAFEVTASGAGTTGPLGVGLAGDDPSQFTTVVDDCTDTSLSDGESCAVRAAFAPTTEGPKSATLSISGVPGGVVSADLQGVADPPRPARLVLLPSIHDFGPVNPGQMVVHRFTVENRGDVESGVPAVEFVGADAATFSVAPLGNDCTAPLAGGESCTFDVAMDTSMEGDFSATMEVSADPGGLDSAELSGQVTTDCLQVMPAMVNFMSGGTQTITITNACAQQTGPLSTTLTTDFAEFQITVDGCSGVALPAGASCTVEVAFSPASGGSKTADLEVSANPGGTVVATLTGSGSLPANLTVSPLSLDFGDVINGGTSTPMAITVGKTAGRIPSGRSPPRSPATSRP